MPAPKGNNHAKGNKGGGRKTNYKQEYAEWALKLSRLGAIDNQLAEAFDVSVSSINKWKLEHVEFKEALKKGKMLADAEVADKLFNRATGYSHADVDIKVIGGEIVQTELIKHYPPDTTAAIFWLKNRQPDKWREKKENDQPVELADALMALAKRLPD